ncbi:hypothetical protein HGRIS_006803 [Hohenbuehelia grisea]|uniref:Uncharacterized protein n=1 Tax=Hohenbuehelia grisea TaxID=104357 RepID=A0ABR3JAM4_9AGAR
MNHSFFAILLPAFIALQAVAGPIAHRADPSSGSISASESLTSAPAATDSASIPVSFAANSTALPSGVSSVVFPSGAPTSTIEVSPSDPTAFPPPPEESNVTDLPPDATEHTRRGQV